MHRSSEVMRPKMKVPVGFIRTDGSVLEGNVYLGGSERVLDLMNNHDPFLPLEVSEGKFILINKNSVIQVEPHDDKWMAGTYSPAPLEPGRTHM